MTHSLTSFHYTSADLQVAIMKKFVIEMINLPLPITHYRFFAVHRLL